MSHHDNQAKAYTMVSKSLPISSANSAGLIEALERSMGVIEFKPDGTIVRANHVFLKTFGYALDEIQGRHHRMLLNPDDAAGSDYQQFWTDLSSGLLKSGRFDRIGKDGRIVWLEASYNPVLDEQGKVVSVIKIATDITESVLSSFENAGKISAIERSMAVIEFDPDGTILHANELFLSISGYSEEEIQGRHHRLFVKQGEQDSAAYATFWRELAAGSVKAGQFERLNKDQQSVWLEATYNPIFDAKGRTVKVVKFAVDITEKFIAAQQMVEKARELEVAMSQAREAERLREELDRTLQEMSTPVTPIWDEILLLPLVGVVDSTRTDDIMRKSLNRISETRSKVFILDISGVPTVDTAVANQLIKITKATRLMGCETVISGLSPAIAHTMVDLGVDVGSVRTTATLRDAFKISLRQVGSLAGAAQDKSGDARGGSQNA